MQIDELPLGNFVLENVAVPSMCFLDETGSESSEHGKCGLVTVDLGIEDGKFCFAENLPDAPRVNARRWTLLPRFIDAHVHLDKTYTIDSTGMGDGTLLNAIDVFWSSSSGWAEREFEPRMEAAIWSALLDGTEAMRSHIDCFDLPSEVPAWRVAQKFKRQFQGLMTLQFCALANVDLARRSEFDTRCAQIAQSGDVLGAYIPPGFSEKPLLEMFLRQADAHGLDVDFHIDENLLTSGLAIELLAEAVLDVNFSGRVLAGHVCALSAVPQTDSLRVLDKIAEAGIDIVSLPRTNLYLQGRDNGTTPRARGITLLHEMRARGINVSVATDNVRDVFYPFGDYDMLRLFADTAVAAHMDQDLPNWFSTISSNPAKTMALQETGTLQFGGPASGVLVQGRTWPSIMTDGLKNRHVLVRGMRLECPQSIQLEFGVGAI